VSQDRKLEVHVRYEAFKKAYKIFLTPTDKLDKLKIQLNKYFVYVDENQTTCHVAVYVPCIVLENDNDKETNNIYHHEMLKDGGDVIFMFFLMVEDNKLYLRVRSNCKFSNCQ